MKNKLYNIKKDLKLTPIEATAVAWAIAGEGTISIHMQKDGRYATKNGKKYLQLAPYVSIVNLKLPFIQRMQEILGGTMYEEVSPLGKPVYRLLIMGIKDVKILLEQIIDYLPIKQENARLIIEFCSTRLVKQIPYSKREKEIALLIRKLNKRGLP